MKNTIVFLFLSLSLSVAAFAQQGRNSYYLSSGLHALSFPQLNDRLSDLGLSSTPGLIGGTGFGGMYANGWIVGGEGYFLSSYQLSNQTLNSLDGGLGYVFVGYELVRKERFSLAGLLGIGAGGVRLSILEAPSSAEFDEFVQGSTANGAMVSTGYALGQASLSAHFYVPGGQLIGLKVGAYGTPSRAWEGPFGSLTNAPEDRFSGVFATLMLGLYR